MAKKKSVSKKAKAAPKKVLAKKAAPKKVAKKAISKKAPVKKVAAKKGPDTRSNEKIGLFGGAFNPVHVGHLNAAMTVKMELGLDKVVFIPVFKAPHREITGPSPADRQMLIEEAIKPYSPDLEVSDVEIKRGGISFTVDTLREFNKTHKPENIFFIVGGDAFKGLQNWREFSELLKLANFVVTSRPGVSISLFEDDLAPELQAFVKASTGDLVSLKSGRTIKLIELDDVNVSSTDIRKRLRSGGNIKDMVPPNVLEMIAEKGFYRRSVPAVKDYKSFSFFCSERALDMKALSLKIYDMTKDNSYSDFSVICSATSTRHAISIAENIVEKVKEEFGIGPISFEGAREGQWVLIDYGGVVIHIFEDAIRGQYRIEELWKKHPQIQNEARAN